MYLLCIDAIYLNIIDSLCHNISHITLKMPRDYEFLKMILMDYILIESILGIFENLYLVFSNY
jgi:hypothetical protein